MQIRRYCSYGSAEKHLTHEYVPQVFHVPFNIRVCIVEKRPRTVRIENSL